MSEIFDVSNARSIFGLTMENRLMSAGFQIMLISELKVQTYFKTVFQSNFITNHFYPTKKHGPKF